MGPGMFDGALKALAFMILILMLCSAACGACGHWACSKINGSYTIKVEKKEK
jgi:hypothetical protein